jgi:threonylcarbamoyladenosine tRNA methylthiotransferase MtaB
VLFQEETDGGSMEGFTENYIRVKAPYQPELINQLTPVTLEKIGEDGKMTGLLVATLQN